MVAWRRPGTTVHRPGQSIARLSALKASAVSWGIISTAGRRSAAPGSQTCCHMWRDAAASPHAALPACFWPVGGPTRRWATPPKMDARRRFSFRVFKVRYPKPLTLNRNPHLVASLRAWRVTLPRRRTLALRSRHPARAPVITRCAPFETVVRIPPLASLGPCRRPQPTVVPCCRLDAR